MIRAFAATIALVATVSLSACSGSDTESVAPTSSAATPSKTASQEWSKQEAGRQYVAMAKPTNEAIAALNRELQSGTSTYKTVAPLCKVEESTTDTFMRKLDAGAWPSGTRAAVDAVLSQLAAVRGALTQCAEASSDEAAQTALGSLDDAVKSNASQLLRVKLGLPSN